MCCLYGLSLNLTQFPFYLLLFALSLYFQSFSCLKHKNSLCLYVVECSNFFLSNWQFVLYYASSETDCFWNCSSKYFTNLKPFEKIHCYEILYQIIHWDKYEMCCWECKIITSHINLYSLPPFQTFPNFTYRERHTLRVF